MSNMTIPSRLFRAAAGALTRADPEGGGREVRLSFSSEVEVLRSFGWEVLGHASGEVDLSLLETSHAPLLLDHRPTIDAKIGTVVSVGIENGRGVAVVRFAASAQADELLARIEGGEGFAVSVGYRVLRFARTGEREGAPILRAVRWQPYEISLVAVPADATVGVGRSDDAAETVSIAVEGDTMSDKTNASTVPAAAVTEGEGQRSAPVDAGAILTAERARAEHIQSVGARMGMGADVIGAAVRSGESAEAFNLRALDFVASPDATASRAREARIGLTEKEERGFSFVRLIDHLSDPANKSKRNAAGFELECAAAAAAKHKGEIRGALVPVDVLQSSAFGKRSDMTVGGGVPAGGYGGSTVATNLLAGSFIDMLRETAVLPRLGARMLGGLVGNIDIPKKLAAANVGWVDEDGSVASSGLRIGQVSASPKTLSARTQLSRKLLMQSSLDVESLVRMDFAESIGLEIDRCAVYGSAEANAPEGLEDKAGVSKTATATPGVWSYADILALWSAVRSANAARGSLGFLLHPLETAALMGTPKFAGGDTPIMAEMGKLLGFAAPDSAQVRGGDVWFGNWADLVIASWGGLDILVDPYTESASGAIRVTAFQDTDFIVRHEQSFARKRAS